MVLNQDHKPLGAARLDIGSEFFDRMSLSPNPCDEHSDRTGPSWRWVSAPPLERRSRIQRVIKRATHCRLHRATLAAQPVNSARQTPDVDLLIVELVREHLD
jgi:hypothetical protein